MFASLSSCLSLLLLLFTDEGQGASTTSPAGPVHYVTAVSSPSSGVRFTSNTDVIRPALTKDLWLLCTFPKPTDLGLASIVSLVISKHETDVLFKEIAAINYLKPKVVTELLNVGARVSGRLDVNGQSFIQLKWTYPSENDAGVYMCEATGLNNRGHPVSTSASIRVTSQPPNIQSLVNQFRIFTKNQSVTDQKLVAQIQKQNATINSLLDRNKKQNVTDQKLVAQIQKQNATIMDLVDDIRRQRLNTNSLPDRVYVLEKNVFKDFFFSRVGLVNGKQFLVSRITGLSITKAEALCNLTGGQLADIKSQAELDEIKRVVQKAVAANSQIQAGYFSPTDGAQEGRWVYRASGQVMTYTGIWRSGYPITDLSKNCATLMYSDWKAKSNECSGFSDATFICERNVVP